MELPIDDKDLDTIINALALGGDTRLYHLLRLKFILRLMSINANIMIVTFKLWIF